tara:strand:- start:520 stop:678 length:159 start_codon:yes stop_codon:yes gene_type:complete
MPKEQRQAETEAAAELVLKERERTLRQEKIHAAWKGLRATKDRPDGLEKNKS